MFLFDYLVEYNRYCNIIGIAVIIGIAALFSRNRSAINFRLVLHALALQFVIAFLVLKTTLGQQIVDALARGIAQMYVFAEQGISMVFGSLANAATPWGFIFAVKVLPVIIFFGAFTALLFHWGIIQRCVTALSVLIRPLLGTSGAETLCAVANSFLGQTEAPLLVRDYLNGMTKSEMLVVMVSGMATISGGILVVFAAMGVPAKHMLASSVMAIPAAIAIAKVLLPETEKAKTAGGAHISIPTTTTNSFDAIARGTSDGMYLALNVGAMLISFLALLGLINYLLGAFSLNLNMVFEYIGIGALLPQLNLELIFSYFFAPFGYLLGFSGNEALVAGQLLGTKVAVNELIAYGQMVGMHLSDRMVNIMTYALCGFSNFSCIGIQIGGIGSLVPEKRAWLTELGLLTVLGGALANLMSAMVAGLLL